MVRARPEHRAGGVRALSTCSTTGCASCRARPARRWRRRRSTTSRCCGSTGRTRTEVSAILRRRLRQGAPGRVRGHRRLRLGRLRRGRRGVPLRARRTGGAGADRLERLLLAQDRGRGARRPRPRRRPPATRDLSLTVLVVFHNMRREAARTLHSLSRSYQRDIDDLDYEVIAIENGSSPRRQRSARTSSRASAPSSTISTSARDSSPSPAHALNRGARDSHAAAPSR